MPLKPRSSSGGVTARSGNPSNASRVGRLSGLPGTAGDAIGACGHDGVRRRDLGTYSNTGTALGLCCVPRFGPALVQPCWRHSGLSHSLSILGYLVYRVPSYTEPIEAQE